MTSHKYYPRRTTHMGGRTRHMYKSTYMGGRTRHAPKHTHMSTYMPTHMSTHMGGRTKEEHRRKRKTMNKKNIECTECSSIGDRLLDFYSWKILRINRNDMILCKRRVWK